MHTTHIRVTGKWYSQVSETWWILMLFIIILWSINLTIEPTLTFIWVQLKNISYIMSMFAFKCSMNFNYVSLAMEFHSFSSPKISIKKIGTHMIIGSQFPNGIGTGAFTLSIWKKKIWSELPKSQLSSLLNFSCVWASPHLHSHSHRMRPKIMCALKALQQVDEPSTIHVAKNIWFAFSVGGRPLPLDWIFWPDPALVSSVITWYSVI